MPNRSEIAKKQIDAFEMLWSHLISLYSDVESLAKRKQDGILSKSRVMMINLLLNEVQIFLKGQPSLKFVALLDEATLPQNADAMIVLGQYKAAMDNFMRSNTRFDEMEDVRRWKSTNQKVGGE